MKNFSIINYIILLFFILANLFAQTESTNWPQFRGTSARGVAENSTPPVTWDVDKGDNIKWKTKVPGLGFSCPVIWEDRIFLTTAISGLEDPEMKVGLYGDIDPVEASLPCAAGSSCGKGQKPVRTLQVCVEPRHHNLCDV